MLLPGGRNWQLMSTHCIEFKEHSSESFNQKMLGIQAATSKLEKLGKVEVCPQF